MPFKYLFYAYHPLTATDRLLNCAEFPIFVCFGDRDFLGTEGADVVVKSSAYFASGESQLLIIPDAGHLAHIQNPNFLAQTIIGFFNGTLKSKFELKAAQDFAPPRPRPKL